MRSGRRRVQVAAAIATLSLGLAPAGALANANESPKSKTVGDCTITGWTEVTPKGNVDWADVRCATEHTLGVTSYEQVRDHGRWVNSSFVSPLGWRDATELQVGVAPNDGVRNTREAADVSIDGHNVRFTDWQDVRRSHARPHSAFNVTLPAPKDDQTAPLVPNRLAYGLDRAISTHFSHSYRNGADRLHFEL